VSATAWPAPAKLNLFLHVVGRRSDGYHLLQTCFRLIDLLDWLEFEPRRDGVIRRIEGPEWLPPEEDLVVRAARLLADRAGCRLGVDIRLRKTIPAGGGLGGGSSDAATVLVALDRLWGLGLGEDVLAGLGLELGADVPLFVRGHTAWGEGVGEALQPVQLPEAWYAVIWPGVAVPTAEVFQAPELTRNSPRITIRGLLEQGARNDCEPVVVARYPEVSAAFLWLGRHGQARMSGTGSCVFAALAGQREAQAAVAGLPEGWRGFAVRGLNESPLRERALADGILGV